MSRKTLTLVFPLSILSFIHLSGCGVFSTESNSLPIQGRIRFNVASGPVQIGSQEPPPVQLSMQTEKTYPCINYSIKYDFLKFGSVLRVQLKEISIPKGCLTALGPASAVRPLDMPDGTYALQFVHKSKSDTYRLMLAESSIQIVPVETGFTERDSTLRYIR